MSSKRKLRRAQTKKQPKPNGNREKDLSATRAQLESERFKRPGSEKLWCALLGWQKPRIDRMWLVQAVHDGARLADRGEPNVARIVEQLRAHCPDAAGKLEPDSVTSAVQLWQTSARGPAGGAPPADDPGPEWQLLANLCERIELGATNAEALRSDWTAWTSLALAATPRTTLMEMLAQAERLAMSLNEMTRSENIDAVASTLRIAWSALAYGDEDSFARMRRFTGEWLAREQSVSKPP